MRQSTIQPLSVNIKERSWLRKQVKASQPAIKVECMLDPGPGSPEIHTTGGNITDMVRVWKGAVQGRKKGEVVWAMEQAKAYRWISRDQMTWTEMSEAVTRYTQTAIVAEERGYQTWAWDLLDRIRTRCQFTMLVGPTPLKACPTYPTWCPWNSLGTHLVITQERALVLLDAVPPEWQQHVLEEAAKADEWAVVARSTLLSSDAETWLLHNTRMLPIRIPKDKIRVYQKGWWASGTKRICKAPPGAIRVWQSSPYVRKDEWTTACTGLLPNPKDIVNLHPRAEYHQYWNNQPSSPNMGCTEMEAWTDGSRQLLETEDGKKALFVGAGAVSDEPDLNFDFQV
eukprot:1685775-Rhodomonas_salina.6